MKRRTFEGMVAYFNKTVADMGIPRKYKIELLGMIAAILQKHDEEVRRWIPVTERLPESKEEDLEYPTVIIDLDGQVALGCYYESTKEWGTGEYFNQKCFPIAWMSLPEPYTEETNA